MVSIHSPFGLAKRLFFYHPDISFDPAEFHTKAGRQDDQR